MKEYRVALMGLGNVGRRLLQLLREKAPILEAEEGARVRVTGVATRRLGFIADEAGLGDALPPASCVDLSAWLSAARPDVLFEATSSNPVNGEPAITQVKAALEAGAHVVTANKGVVVHAWDEVQALAASSGRRFLFEATVMGGAPVFSLFRETRPLAKVLMGAPLRLEQVAREGIRGVTAAVVQAARAEGKSVRLVASAERWDDGVEARVRPESVPVGDPLGAVSGTDLVLQIETDIVPSLTLTAKRGGPMATAYDMLADFVTIVRDERG